MMELVSTRPVVLTQTSVVFLRAQKLISATNLFLRGQSCVVAFNVMNRAALFVLLISLVTGCSTIYLHDQGLEQQLKDANTRFEAVTKNSSSVWEASRSNLVAASELKNKALVRSSEVKLAASLNNLPFDNWRAVQKTAISAETDKTEELKKAAASNLEAVEKVAKLVTLVGEDPGGRLDKAPIPKNGAPGGTLVAESANLLEAIRGNTNLTKVLGDVKSYLGNADTYLSQAENDILPTLDGYINSKALSNLIDVFRKVDYPNLVQGLNLATGKDTDPLPTQLREASQKYLGVDLKTLGDLKKLVKSGDAGILEVRLTLLDETRRTMGELRKAQLAALKIRVGLLNERLEILEQILFNAQKIRTQIHDQSKSTTNFLGSPVLGWIEAKVKNYNSSLKDSTEYRDSLSDNINLLVLYANLKGSLDLALRLNQEALNSVEHQERNELDRIATEAHERLVQLGFRGTISFAEGGVTEQEIANWLRAAQTAALGVIGVGVN